MDTHDLLQKIKTIPIRSSGLTGQLLAGNFRSVFRGQGIEFDEARHYQPGDDVRTIDWNASARFGVPFIKLFREERDLTILILLDTSASMHRSKNLQRLSPYEQGLLAAALIAFSAEQKSQRVGALLFDRDIHRVLLPRKGRQHLMALVSAVLQYQDVLKDDTVSRNKAAARSAISKAGDSAVGSNIAEALSSAGRLLKRRSLVVLISDFMSVNWEEELSRLCRAHDVIALRVSDPADAQVPDWGLTVMEDPETGVRVSAPSTSQTFREAWKEWHAQRLELWSNTCRRASAACLDLPVTTDAATALYRFFSADSRIRPAAVHSAAGAFYHGEQ